MSEDVKIPLPQSLQEIVGGLLFASETPLTATELRDAIRAVDAEEGESKEVMDVYRTCTPKEVAEALRGLEKALEVAGCGFRLVCAGGAYRLQSVPSCGRYVRAMLKMDRPSRLGRASLETLAIVAYRQPLTKSEIESIRGVDVSGNLRTLVDLQLVRLVGKSELPGHPFLYGTTPLFLEHFGLASLQQLNELDPTLQRSNPKAKAASYRKKEETPAQEAEATAADATSDDASADVEVSDAADAAEVSPVPEVPEVSEVAVVSEVSESSDDLLSGEDDDLLSGEDEDGEEEEEGEEELVDDDDEDEELDDEDEEELDDEDDDDDEEEDSDDDDEE